MSEQTDASLVGAALAGKPECFCELVRRYQEYVYGVTLGILADFDLALDAAQEAFLCAYCELPKLRESARFGAWLCGIARNTAFEIRRDRRQQECLAGKAAESAGASAAAPSAQQVAAANEQRESVRQALLRLQDADREALMLHYADGLSYSQICSFLSISSGTLKGRLQRGRAALRKELAMVERNCRENAPDEAFTRRLEQAIRVFGAKGPATHHLPSAWHRSLRDQTNWILQAGEEGFRIDVALSHSGSARQRYHAVTRLALRKDDRGFKQLERLLEDRAARVRRQAVGWYAARIHPDNPSQDVRGFREPARTSVKGLEKLLERLSDENFNVRRAAVAAVGAYVDSGDPRVPQALRGALDDSKHKVRHAAAAILRVPCPGCGRTW